MTDPYDFLGKKVGDDGPASRITPFQERFFTSVIFRRLPEAP